MNATTKNTPLTEKDLEEFERLTDVGPDDAFREREAIQRLVAEVRRLHQVFRDGVERER